MSAVVPKRRLSFDRATSRLTVRVGKKQTVYHVRRIGSEFGVAASFVKLATDERQTPLNSTRYLVGVDGTTGMCECVACSKDGTCRHVKALRVLVARGLLD